MNDFMMIDEISAKIEAVKIIAEEAKSAAQAAVSQTKTIDRPYHGSVNEAAPNIVFNTGDILRQNLKEQEPVFAMNNVWFVPRGVSNADDVRLIVNVVAYNNAKYAQNDFRIEVKIGKFLRVIKVHLYDGSGNTSAGANAIFNIPVYTLVEELSVEINTSGIGQYLSKANFTAQITNTVPFYMS